MQGPAIGGALALAAALLAGACGSPRNEAAAELRRLDEAMRRHAAEHGAFPRTLDRGRPASAANLPHAAEGDVTVRLVQATAEGYQATARRKAWICWMSVGPGKPGVPDCAPVSPSLKEVPTPAEQAPRWLDGVLTAPPADSTAPAPPPSAP